MPYIYNPIDSFPNHTDSLQNPYISFQILLLWPYGLFLAYGIPPTELGAASAASTVSLGQRTVRFL